jgi:hypothetical protein
MARARNIKPGFFTNDQLGELPPLARLLFAGLWTLCDREGRVEDRPKKIKAELLPYDECDGDALLQMLADTGFIARYQVGAVKVIQVLEFAKHQNPHMKEAASTLPALCLSGAVPVQEQDNAQPEPEQARLNPSLLIPDSGFLIADSRGTSPPEVAASGPTPAGRVCMALKAAGISAVNPNNQTLRMLLAAGAEVGEFVGFAAKALENAPGSAFGYVLKCVQGEREKAAQTAGKLYQGALPNKQQALENRNRAVGADWLAQQGAA